MWHLQLTNHGPCPIGSACARYCGCAGALVELQLTDDGLGRHSMMMQQSDNVHIWEEDDAR